MTALRTIRAMAALVALAGTALAYAENAFAPTSVGGEAGSAIAIAHWQIQSSAKAQQSGAEVSSAGFSTGDWFPVSGRATVMAGLLENGTYKDVFYGDNLRAAEEPDSSGNVFVIPWWYRTEFTVSEGGRATRTLLRINGMIASADVWFNGNLVADQAAVAGAYPVHELDVTRWVNAGINTLALRVHPADPRSSLVIGWVDWNPTPPDNNMGPWRGVDIVRTGPVEIRFPQVTSTLSLPDLKRAALTVKVEARNLDASPHDATITGVVAGVSLKRTIHLDPGQTQTVSFSPKSDPGLDLKSPQVWWPVGMGAHPLYTSQMAAAVDGVISDRASATFGIRSVSSHLTQHGYLQFVINGKPVLIRGAGWAPDMFLRDDPKRMKAEFSYIVNLGLNTIRSEGKLEDERFYDLADRDGIMILAGWECCDKWESWAKTGGDPWDVSDEKVAAASMASEARLLRNHPSVIGFLIGSDNAPPAALSKMYVDTLHAEDWSLPIIAAAVDQATAETGPSGMKMAGPYSWVPPVYWYADKLGGAFGFDSEVSAGASIPLLDDLTRMLSPQELEALWKYPQARQYHASAAWSIFATIEPFDTALSRRYGPPKSLADYVAKAQLDNYDNVRAQFEAFNAHMDAAKPSTGVIYWMLNNAWPSLHWHLYDYFLNPAGAYFGAKMANEPVHIQYSYDTRAIMLVNHTLTIEHGLRAAIRVRNLDGSVAYERRLQDIALAGSGARQLAMLPPLDGLSRTYFIELELARADGKSISRNVYWLSTQTDELDWAHSNWYLTPVTRYADLTPLQSLPTATAKVRATMRHEGAEDIASVTLTVPPSSKAVALFQHVSIKRPAGGELMLPILWSDNDVTLWPGESLTLTARFATPGAATPVVEVSGWNVPTISVPVAVESRTAALQERNH
ncbi:MAG TPA: glycoside hydrolase family 2 TIM barrel-domain containing protein [Steroidobacteraceae bacterium]|nr:glycoside hydrolase family 2 TIM barrel-domain containing protein [Steroidobacteraceae bacterium]